MDSFVLRANANAWARGEGFTKEQLTEFDHLMGMVASTHISKNKLTGVSYGHSLWGQ